MTPALDRGAVATAALTALVVGAIGLGFEELKRLLAERRERSKGGRS